MSENGQLELTGNSKYANKRTPEEREQHRIFCIEKLMQGYTHEQIADLLYDKSGIKLSRGQISYDIRQVRENWRTEQLDTYEAYVNQELTWLDMYERTLWEEYRKSASDKISKKVEEELAKVEGELSDLVVSKITTFTQEAGAGDPKILDLILNTRKDRRKILGLYAPSKAIVRTEHVHMEKTKGYEVVNPDDWPGKDEAIDGEFSTQD